MAKTNLKVNDWGISTSWINQEPRQITKIELATTSDEEDFVFFRDSRCVELEYIQKWIPKVGDWCWNVYFGLVKIINFKNEYRIEVKCVHGMNVLYDNHTAKLEELEPFIGELPSRAKRINDERK